MIQSKNLKLKLGLCGLALTSFLALNSRSVVHADTVSGGNANAITWDSDQDDSQVVKEDSNQSQPAQNVQGQALATQSVQSNVQKRAETSAVRVSNFDTSAVNRNNVQNARNNVNVKVATVHDTLQMPVQKQKVAQFNQGSKIYTLNGSNQLSKNNGDGYVITNAGTYNGRAVDIGVTINNVQDDQGSYTTKWSNGDNADVTGKVDNDFNYQNSALVGSKPEQVTVPDKTRTRSDTKVINYPYIFFWDNSSNGSNTPKMQRFDNGNKELTDWIYQWYNTVDKNDLYKAVQDIVNNYAGKSLDWRGYPYSDNELKEAAERKLKSVPDSYAVPMFFYEDHDPESTGDATAVSFGTIYMGRNNGRYEYKDITSVTDHLQLDHVNNGSLNYNYTVGLYDAQTGDLITDLKAEYKGKTGAQATASTNVTNSAIKNKIQQINQNKATVSYTGTSANDDVAFYQETRQVNPQDKNVNRQVQRVIHINFPNGVKPKSYDNITDSAGNKLTLDSNNNLTQSMSFTRTGVQNIVSGHVTYGNWQQHGAINAVTLPAIPGYTMTQTK